VFLGGGVPSVEPQEELRGPSGFYFEGFYFEPKDGGEVRIFGVYTNKQTKNKINKQTKFVEFFGFYSKINKDCVAVRHLGNWDCSKKSTKNKLVNRSWDKQSESVNVWP